MSKATMCIAIVSFMAVVDGRSVIVQKGDLVAMPSGADWLKRGLVAKKGKQKR